MPTPSADSEPLEPHAVHSQRMLDHAAQMIEDGDRLQASEKMWGAFAHRIEEIAAKRGWACRTHDDNRAIAEHIARRTGNAGILDLYHHANNAHQNFYRDRLSLPDLVGLLERIQALTPLLDPDDPNLPQADDPPTNNLSALPRQGLRRTGLQGVFTHPPFLRRQESNCSAALKTPLIL